MYNKLDGAYKGKNYPRYIPDREIDRRQKEIQGLKMNYERLDNSLKSLETKKYGYNEDMFKDNYVQDENLDGLSSKQLLHLQKDKITDQDKQIEDITLKVKQGKKKAMEVNDNLNEQNKNIEEMGKNVEKLESAVERTTKKFENYVANASTCKMMIIIILEVVVAILIYVLFS